MISTFREVVENIQVRVIAVFPWIGRTLTELACFLSLVQAGFGWTNGITLYLASRYGHIINTPNCPPVIVNGTSSNSTNPATLVARDGESPRRLASWQFSRAIWEKAGLSF